LFCKKKFCDLFATDLILIKINLIKQMKVVNLDIYFEKRTNPRQHYLGLIFFATANRYFEGKINNLSRYGLFIETKVSLSIGDIITIPLPYLNRRHIKCRGQIRWCNQNGYGIKILVRRNTANLKVMK
jgi:hypothetical protein